MPGMSSNLLAEMKNKRTSMQVRFLLSNSRKPASYGFWKKSTNVQIFFILLQPPAQPKAAPRGKSEEPVTKPLQPPSATKPVSEVKKEEVFLPTRPSPPKPATSQREGAPPTPPQSAKPAPPPILRPKPPKLMPKPNKPPRPATMDVSNLSSTKPEGSYFLSDDSSSFAFLCTPIRYLSVVLAPL